MITGVSNEEEIIIKNLLEKYSQYSFYYYGSRVKGNFNKTSDLDVLIKGNEEMPLSILIEIKEKFDESKLPYIVNFCDFYTIDEYFYKLIENDLVKIL